MTRAGKLELAVPDTQILSVRPGARSGNEKALIAVLAECYAQGVSTRQVGKIYEQPFRVNLRGKADQLPWPDLARVVWMSFPSRGSVPRHQVAVRRQGLAATVSVALSR